MIYFLRRKNPLSIYFNSKTYALTLLAKQCFGLPGIALGTLGMSRIPYRFFFGVRFVEMLCALGAAMGAMSVAPATSALADDIVVTKAVPGSSSASSAYDWSGFYAGG